MPKTNSITQILVFFFLSFLFSREKKKEKVVTVLKSIERGRGGMWG